MDTDDIKKIYANEQRQGTVVCEQCGKARVIDVAPLLHLNKPVKVKCGCGHGFTISIEVRQFYRKATQLAGTYVCWGTALYPGTTKGRMLVEDLSRTGIGFRVYGPHTIRVQDTVEVHFVLDDAQHSPITKRAVVRRVQGHLIGAAFLDFDAFNETNRTLGFYLMAR